MKKNSREYLELDCSSSSKPLLIGASVAVDNVEELFR